MTETWSASQQRFYASRPHRHLQYSETSAYARNLVDHVLAAAGVAPQGRLLEVGCGAGRFTMHLVERTGADLVALDLSETLLARLRAWLAARGASVEARCRLQAGDVHQADALLGERRFDAVVGFFILHHLDDLAGALAPLARLLRPGGRLVFVEPNRRNPLFLLQILCCPDMTWADERGVFTLGRTRLRRAFGAAGLATPAIETFGFFPPQIVDRWSAALRLERRLERIPLLRPVLPFRLVRSERVAG